jgi:cubilin
MFNMEASDSCNNDYLEIRAGATGADPLIGVFCGDQIPNNITASNKLWIKFKSDSLNVGSGFLAHYSLSECFLLQYMCVFLSKFLSIFRAWW